MFKKDYYVWNVESRTIVDIGTYERMSEVASLLNTAHQTDANRVIKAGEDN